MLSLLLQVLFVTPIFAAEVNSTATIKQVDAKNKVISIEAKSGTQAGDRWMWQSGDEICVFQVYTVRGAVAQARSAECESIKKIKSGQNLKLSVVDEEKVAATLPLPPSVSDKRKIVRERRNPDLPTDNESWYLLFGGGVSSHSYQGEFKDTIKAIDDLNGKTSRSMGATIDLGVYWPVNHHKSMLGVGIESSAEQYSNNDQTSGDVTATITQRLLAFSAIHSFGQNLGDGWFVRGDAGIAQASIIFDDLFVGSKTKSGMGLLLGGGYGIPIGMDTRVLLFLNVSTRHFDSKRFTVSTLGADFLF